MLKLRVLVSAYSCNPSSSARLHPGEDIKGWRFVEQISRFHDVWVITHSYNKHGVEKALEKSKLAGVHFIFIDLPKFLRILNKIEFAIRIYYYLWQIQAWREAKRWHRQIHFNVIHHISFGNDWMPSYMGALLSIPFIWGPLGGGQKTPYPLLKEYSLYGKFAEKIREIAQFFGRWDFFRRRCLKKAKAILVCNKETRAKIPHKYGKKLYWFPLNGIFPEDIVDTSEYSKKNIKFRVVTAGRLHRLKGISLGIRAFAKFHAKYPDTEFKIIGRGPEYNNIMEIIAKLHLQESVDILPWMTRHDLLKTFCSSHIFLFPSFRDGGGAVVVEAMAAGVPIICLDSGGPGFHVQPEWGIKIVPSYPERVVDRIAIALETLYKDQILRDKMGQASLQRAKDFYLSDRLGEQLNAIYQKVLS